MDFDTLYQRELAKLEKEKAGKGVPAKKAQAPKPGLTEPPMADAAKKKPADPEATVHAEPPRQVSRKAPDSGAAADEPQVSTDFEDLDEPLELELAPESKDLYEPLEEEPPQESVHTEPTVEGNSRGLAETVEGEVPYEVMEEVPDFDADAEPAELEADASASETSLESDEPAAAGEAEAEQTILDECHDVGSEEIIVSGDEDLTPELDVGLLGDLQKMVASKPPPVPQESPGVDMLGQGKEMLASLILEPKRVKDKGTFMPTLKYHLAEVTILAQAVVVTAAFAVFSNVPGAVIAGYTVISAAVASVAFVVKTRLKRKDGSSSQTRQTGPAQAADGEVFEFNVNDLLPPGGLPPAVHPEDGVLERELKGTLPQGEVRRRRNNHEGDV